MARVFNTKEWGIGEWAAAIGIGWVVYQAVRDNERGARAERRAIDREAPPVLVLDDGRVLVREDV